MYSTVFIVHATLKKKKLNHLTRDLGQLDKLLVRELFRLSMEILQQLKLFWMIAHIVLLQSKRQNLGLGQRQDLGACRDHTVHEDNLFVVNQFWVVGECEERAGVLAVGLVFQEGGKDDLVECELQQVEFYSVTVAQWQQELYCRKRNNMKCVTTTLVSTKW